MSDPVVTESPDARLTVVCEGGETIGCTNFKAVDGGVLLFEDPKRNRVVGFVPHDEVRFVVPSETADRVLRGGGARGFDDPLMQLPGVGSTYAKRLRSAGYTSIGELVGADPAVLADETGATGTRTAKWVEHAERTSGSDEE